MKISIKSTAAIYLVRRINHQMKYQHNTLIDFFNVYVVVIQKIFNFDGWKDRDKRITKNPGANIEDKKTEKSDNKLLQMTSRTNRRKVDRFVVLR